jgi:2-C-methyl-D-erythritol 2,4-cyclodiphosphate synthase
VRVGQGWDIHRLVSGRPLRLAGVDIPFERGLLGHSDGDVVLHALTDALLGALGEGDIGTHFPDDDASLEGVDSARLLEKIVDLTLARGSSIANADLTILAEQPKLAPHMQAMRARLGSLLRVEPGRVGLKAKTMEGLGAVGRGDAIAALAVVLVSGPAPVRRTRARG